MSIKVIVISKSEEKLALEAGIKPEKLALIYNGISPIITNAVKNKQTDLQTCCLLDVLMSKRALIFF